MTALIIMSAIVLVGVIAAFTILKSDNEDESGHDGSLSEALSLAEESEMPAPPEPAAPGLEAEKSGIGSLFGKLLGALNRKKAPAADALSADTAEEPSGGPLSGLLAKLNLGGLLAKLKGGKNKDDNDALDAQGSEPLPSLTDSLSEEEAQSVGLEHTPQTGTASLRTMPADERAGDTIAAKPEPEAPPTPGASAASPAQSSEPTNALKAKVERLESMLIEKGNELQTAKNLLENEINNRKEFEKVKELLENEITQLKERSRDVKSEGKNAQSEIERHERRAAQLKEKTATLEKDLKEKDEKIDDLVKRLQTFASPGTASTPPVKEPASTPPPPDKEPDPEPEPEAKPELKPEPETESAPEAKAEPMPEPEAPKAPPPPGATVPKPLDEMLEPSASESPEEDLPGIRMAPAQEHDGPVSSDETPTDSGADQPPEPYEVPDSGANDPEDSSDAEDDSGGKEENFLKLQPDIMTDDQADAQEGSIEKEIEQSLELPPEPEVRNDPGRSQASQQAPDPPAADHPAAENTGPAPSGNDEKTIEIVDPEDTPDTNNNTDSKKE